jgi:hypothetical protein
MRLAHHGGMRGATFLLGIALAGVVAMARAACPPPATVTVIARNGSGVSPATLTLDGERVADDTSCSGSGATTYHLQLDCTGSGDVRCGLIEGLRPGSWIHRLTLTVPDSDPQEQAQRMVLLGGQPTDVSNALVWDIYARTFVVRSADPTDLQASLDQAAQYTDAHRGPVLLTFSRAVFPGAQDPKRIYLVDPAALPSCSIGDRNRCPPSANLPSPTAGLCFTGNRIVVDGLDADAQPGGVVLSVGVCGREVVRLYGSDNVLRGLVIEGTQQKGPAHQLDTVAITDARARRNRLEQLRIIGPTRGDAVSVAFGAGTSDDAGPADNVIVASEISGAEDKGVKVVNGGVVRIERSCLHDNMNGGVQLTTSDTDTTIGGSAVAIESIVQHNVGGGAGHGFIVGVEDKAIETHIRTRGNVVRFNGTRGISVANAATADFFADVVTDNYIAGLRIRTMRPGIAPDARLRGSAFVCNYAPGYCVDGAGKASAVCRVDADCGRCVGGTTRCRKDADCPGVQTCGFDVCNLDFCDPTRCGSASCCADTRVSTGIGLGLDPPNCPTCPTCLPCSMPSVDVGSVIDPGRNAFTSNVNPNATGPGITQSYNVTSGLVTPSSIPAAGNQWEHCRGTACNPSDVVTNDIRVAAGTTPLDLGTLGLPSAGPAPIITSISPARPRGGELVRVYGGPFNAIDVAGCSPVGLPADPCSAENPTVAATNAADAERGNHVRVALNGVSYDAPVHQVTPSMLMFKMPADCDAAGTVTVARGADVGAPAVICDPKGCVGRAAGDPCEDGDACTVDDSCDGEGACVAGGPLVCDAPCLTCDPTAGCVPKSVSSPCDDQNVCTVGDHCSGNGNACVSQGVLACVGACQTGDCDPAVGCEPKPEGATCREASGPCDVAERCTGSSGGCPADAFASSSTACDDGNACTDDDRCNGAADLCVGVPVMCDGPCFTGTCDPGAGCLRRDGARALTCRVGECRKSRLHRKASKVALVIDHAIEVGRLPKARKVKRLRRLLKRCGIVGL